MTERNRCATCEWFVPDEKDPANAQGVCKRMPPMLLYAPVQQVNLAGETMLGVKIFGSAWPYVMPIHYCGEFKALPHASIINH